MEQTVLLQIGVTRESEMEKGWGGSDWDMNVLL